MRSSRRRRPRSAISPRRARSCRSPFVGRDGDGLDSIVCRHRHQARPTHPRPVMVRVGAGLRRPPSSHRSRTRAAKCDGDRNASDRDCSRRKSRRAEDDADRRGIHELHAAEVDHEIAVVERDRTGEDLRERRHRADVVLATKPDHRAVGVTRRKGNRTVMRGHGRRRLSKLHGTLPTSLAVIRRYQGLEHRSLSRLTRLNTSGIFVVSRPPYTYERSQQ